MPTRRRHQRSARRLTLLRCALHGVLVGLATAAPAEEPAAARQREVDQRVAELSSPLRAERQRAERSLLELGPKVLELLPAPEDVENQATRVAVRQLRVKLERVAAEQSVLPSRVSFQGEATVAEIAAQISRQTGNPIDVNELPAANQERRITVDFQELPFWECLDRFAEAADLAWNRANEQPELRLTRPAQVPAGSQTAYAGAFRISLASLTPQRGTVRADLQLQIEPRLRPLFVQFRDADFSAVAGEAALSPFSPRAVTELPMTSREPAWFSVQFKAADAQALPPLNIRGRATVHVAASPLDVRFEDLSGKRVIYQRHGGVGVTLKRSTWTAGTDGRSALTARLSIVYDTGGPEFESHRAWIYHNDVRLESPAGTTFAPDAGFSVTRQADGGVEVEYRFSNLPDRTPRDWMLVYVAPTLLIDVPIDFTFEHVPVSNGK